MKDWVPASRRTQIYVWVAGALWTVAMATGLMSVKPNDTLDIVCHALLFVMLVMSWGITLWAALHCRNPRLRLGWLLIAFGQILSLSTSLFMTVMAFLQPSQPYDGAAPLLSVAFLMVGVGLAVGVTSIGGAGERLGPFLQSAALSIFMFGIMTAALLAPGPTMPFAIGPRDISAVMRLVIDCGVTFFAGTYATLLQLRLSDGHRARSWMWAAASALVAAMGDVGAPLVDLGHGQIYPALLWCLGDLLLAVAAALAADFELAEAPVESTARVTQRAMESLATEPLAEPVIDGAELAES